MNGYYAITDSFQFIFSDNLFLLKSLINISLLFIMVCIAKFFIIFAVPAAILTGLTFVALISKAIYKNDTSKITGWNRASNKFGILIVYIFTKLILLMILGGIAGTFTSKLNVGVIIIILTELSLLFSFSIIALEDTNIFNVFYRSATTVWQSLGSVFIFLLSFLGFVILWNMSLNLTLKMTKELIQFFYSGSLKGLEIIIYLLYGAFLILVLIISTGFLYYRLKLSKENSLVKDNIEN